MTRRRLEWKISNSTLILGERTLIMGVLNVTPDSFSDGGRYLDPDLAYARALEIEDQGADLIDIGAESTRPGSERISEAEELRRLVPLLKRLKGKLSIPICVDTYKPGVAAKALEHGAQIINDPSGLTWEPDLVKIVRDANAGLVINHMRGTPATWATLPPLRDVVGTVASELGAAVHRARQGGVPQDRILVDPGLGFGKRKEQNSELLGRLEELRSRVEQPVLIGVSRKSFLAQADSRDTEFATAAAVALAVANGAAVVRVHDVIAMRAAAGVADALLDALPEPRPVEPRRKPSGLSRQEKTTGESGEESRRTSVWRPKPPAEAGAGQDDRRRDQPLFTRSAEPRRQTGPEERPQRQARGHQRTSGGERQERSGAPPPARDAKTPDPGRQGWSPVGPGRGAPSGQGTDQGSRGRPPRRDGPGGGSRPPRRGGSADRPEQRRSGGRGPGRWSEGTGTEDQQGGGRPPRQGGSGRPAGKKWSRTGPAGGPGERDAPPRGGSRPPRPGSSRGGPQTSGNRGPKTPRKGGGGKPKRYGGGPPPRKRT